MKSLNIDSGASPSDFEIACGRAGVEISSSMPGHFNIGSPDSSPTSDSDGMFQFSPRAQLSGDNTSKFKSIAPHEEDVIKDAAIKDLTHLFDLPVSTKF